MLIRSVKWQVLARLCCWHLSHGFSPLQRICERQRTNRSANARMYNGRIVTNCAHCCPRGCKISCCGASQSSTLSKLSFSATSPIINCGQPLKRGRQITSELTFRRRQKSQAFETAGSRRACFNGLEGLGGTSRASLLCGAYLAMCRANFGQRRSRDVCGRSLMMYEKNGTFAVGPALFDAIPCALRHAGDGSLDFAELGRKTSRTRSRDASSTRPLQDGAVPRQTALVPFSRHHSCGAPVSIVCAPVPELPRRPAKFAADSSLALQSSQTRCWLAGSRVVPLAVGAPYSFVLVYRLLSLRPHQRSIV